LETNGITPEEQAKGEGFVRFYQLHRKGPRVILQTSTGEILEIDEENLPEAYKSRPLHRIQRAT
jgi:hypothetical protein